MKTPSWPSKKLVLQKRQVSLASQLVSKLCLSSEDYVSVKYPQNYVQPNVEIDFKLARYADISAKAADAYLLKQSMAFVDDDEEAPECGDKVKGKGKAKSKN